MLLVSEKELEELSRIYSLLNNSSMKREVVDRFPTLAERLFYVYQDIQLGIIYAETHLSGPYGEEAKKISQMINLHLPVKKQQEQQADIDSLQVEDIIKENKSRGIRIRFAEESRPQAVIERRANMSGGYNY